MKISRVTLQALFLLSLWLGLGLQAHAQTDTVTYVYTDPQGTPLVEADAQGNVIARYDYTPYGRMVTSLGSPPNGPGYTGHVNDPERGLVYMQQRYYQPDGRFLSPDPVGPTPGNLFNFNRYEYANNSPVVNIDPTGRNACGNDDDATCHVVVAIRDRSKDSNGKYNDSYTKVHNQRSYNATATVIVNGKVTGAYLVKTTPSNSSQSATVANGTYEATLTTHSGQLAIRLQPTDAIPTIGPNPSRRDGASIAQGILIHRAGINNFTGVGRDGRAVSNGCQVVCRTEYRNFLHTTGMVPDAGAPQRHFTVSIDTSENEPE